MLRHETLRCNKWLAGRRGRRVTVRDIAAQTGVSIATVSRVLNDQANVAPETRELVRSAPPSSSARGPRARATGRAPAPGAVYLRCPYVLTDYFGLIVSVHRRDPGAARARGGARRGEAAQQASVLPSLPSGPASPARS